MKLSKSKLAIILSKLDKIEEQNIGLEQYMTPSEVAAELLWSAAMRDEIKGRNAADLGCGNGLFGIGMLLLGANKAVFVEKSESSIAICRKNIQKIKEEFAVSGESEIIRADINEFDEKVDIVMMNPPFGTKKKHADKEFLERAFNSAETVYSIHKFPTRNFVERFSREKGFKITDEKRFLFPIAKSRPYHKKKAFNVDVAAWRFEKI